ncbi:uncharacterized protein LOC122319888 [Drosophila ficusphila]|uniref:uncharacterized protein LOC122319888 n=1 Tax=Drosophila ficusphila TaxID=30025 RepID=UPI001C8AB8AC|nr:uncharacterized protein LOC122319888 [Drosophila ficusphila]
MSLILKFLILVVACLNLKILDVFGLLNPMLRPKCSLGEHRTCSLRIVYCWMYNCVCLPEHVYLGLGKGCLYEKFT